MLRGRFAAAIRDHLPLALGLALLLVLLRMTMAGPAVAEPWRLPLTFGTGLVHAAQDLLVTGGLFAAFVAAATLARRDWTRRLLQRLFAVVAVLFLLAAVVNRQAVEVLGLPITFQWLMFADFFRSLTPQTAVTGSLDLAFWLGFAMAPLLLFGFTRLLRRLLEAPLARLPQHRFWPTLAIGIAGYTLASLGYFYAKDQSITGSRHENPAVVLLRTAIADQGSNLFLLPTAAGDDDFRSLSPTVSVRTAAPPAAPAAIGPVAMDPAAIDNVVVFVAESVGHSYVGARFGGHSTTPHLDRLQATGIRFSDHYAPMPSSSRSLFSLLTGLYPRVAFRSETRQFPDLEVDSLSSLLGDAGWRTALFYSADLRFQSADRFLEGRGIETIRDVRDIPCVRPVTRTRWQFLDSVEDRCTAEAAIDWIDAVAGSPFFLMLWTNDAHHPYYDRGRTIPFVPERPLVDRYLNAVRATDAAIGRVVDHLGSIGALERTLIVVVGDHGQAFGEHGLFGHSQSVYEEEVRVPLILANPQLFAGTRDPTLGGIVDIAPTIVDLLGRQPPAEWQGRSLFAAERAPRTYFAAGHRDMLTGFREGQRKYVYNATRDVLEIYDLATDPGERSPLAVSDAERRRTLQRLASWVQYQEELFARLADGAVIRQVELPAARIEHPLIRPTALPASAAR